jgi:hypothetical protein
MEAVFAAMARQPSGAIRRRLDSRSEGFSVFGSISLTAKSIEEIGRLGQAQPVGCSPLEFHSAELVRHGFGQGTALLRLPMKEFRADVHSHRWFRAFEWTKLI